MTKPWCQIFDLDGTLALRTSDRSPYDWNRVGEDKVNSNVAYLTHLRPINLMSDRDDIIIMSGRSDVCRVNTIDWLEYEGILYDELYMRKAGDIRCDTIVKQEMYYKHINDKYNVRFVVDDRPKVCRMWRDLGLTLLQVGNPYVEF
jgi:hypothetical protein